MDREKVIKGLQIERECVSRNCDRDCGRCDLVQDRDWLLSVYDDALAMLKEHEAVTACWSDDVWHWIEGDRNGTDPSKRTTGEMIDTFRCTWCGFYQYWKTPYCPNCGAKMEGR